MKGKWGVIGLLGGIAVVAVILLIVFGGYAGKNNKTEEEKNQPVNWDISYENTDRSPYGTFLFYELLKKKYSEENKKLKVIDDDFRKELADTINKKPEIYFLISNSMTLNKNEKEALKTFVEKGNYAFISLDRFPETFTSVIEETHYIETSRAEKTRVNFYSGELRNKKSYYEFYYYFENQKQLWKWKSFKSRHKYIDDTYYEDSEDEKEYDYDNDPGIYEEDMYYNEPLPNEDELFYNDFTSYEFNSDSNDVFIKVPYGKGAFYFHSVPLCFTNLSLLKEKNVEHMEKILACLPDAVPLWDKYGQMDFRIYLEKFGEADSGGSGDKPRQSPLQFILSKKSLKWAYYTLLGTLLFYILFQIKRKQKVIPAVAKNVNSSLDFIDTVSKLYLQQYKHKNLLRHKYRILLNFIRERYFITTAKPDQQYISMVAKKSQLEEGRISRLFATFESIEKSTNVSDDMLIAVHQQVEYFYKNCK